MKISNGGNSHQRRVVRRWRKRLFGGVDYQPRSIEMFPAVPALALAGGLSLGDSILRKALEDDVRRETDEVAAYTPESWTPLPANAVERPFRSTDEADVHDLMHGLEDKELKMDYDDLQPRKPSWLQRIGAKFDAGVKWLASHRKGGSRYRA